MADLHALVVLAQRLAEGRRRHPSNAAFGQWVKDNDLGHLTHRDRAALLRIAALDPQETSAAILASTYTTPERLWYRVLCPVRKTPTTALVPVRKAEPPEPAPGIKGALAGLLAVPARRAEPEVRIPPAELPQRIERYLNWLANGDPDRESLQWFDEHVRAVAGVISYKTRNPAKIFALWLDEQDLLDLYDDDELGDDRALLMTLVEHDELWETVMRKMGWRP